MTTRTLTLTGAAVNVMVDPLTGKLLVFGTIAFGDSGVLLIVGGPVSTVAVPFLATFVKGSWKFSVAGAVSVFEI